MLSLSPLKIVIVVVVTLVLVGPDKLPGLARQIGGAWRAFRSFSTKVETEVRSTMPDLPSTGDIARLARSPVAFLDSLAKLDTDPLVPDPTADPAPQTDALTPDPGAPPSPDRATSSTDGTSSSEEPSAEDEQAFGDPTMSDVEEVENGAEGTDAAPDPWADQLVPSEPMAPRPTPVVRPAPPTGTGAIDPNLN